MISTNEPLARPKTVGDAIVIALAVLVFLTVYDVLITETIEWRLNLWVTSASGFAFWAGAMSRL